MTTMTITIRLIGRITGKIDVEEGLHTRGAVDAAASRSEGVDALQAGQVDQHDVAGARQAVATRTAHRLIPGRRTSRPGWEDSLFSPWSRE